MSRMMMMIPEGDEDGNEDDDDNVGCSAWCFSCTADYNYDDLKDVM